MKRGQGNKSRTRGDFKGPVHDPFYCGLGLPLAVKSFKKRLNWPDVRLWRSWTRKKVPKEATRRKSLKTLMGIRF